MHRFSCNDLIQLVTYIFYFSTHEERVQEHAQRKWCVSICNRKFVSHTHTADRQEYGMLTHIPDKEITKKFQCSRKKIEFKTDRNGMNAKRNWKKKKRRKKIQFMSQCRLTSIALTFIYTEHRKSSRLNTQRSSKRRTNNDDDIFFFLCYWFLMFEKFFHFFHIIPMKAPKIFTDAIAVIQLQ